MNLQELLESTVICEDKDGELVQVSPDFLVSVGQSKDKGRHFIIHPHGYDGNTLDFIVCGNDLEQV